MATVTGAAGLSAIGALPKIRVSGVNAYVDVYRLCKLNISSQELGFLLIFMISKNVIIPGSLVLITLILKFSLSGIGGTKLNCFGMIIVLY